MGSAASVCGPCFRDTTKLNAKESAPIAINCPLDVFTPRDEGVEGFEVGEDFLVDTPNGKDRAVFKYFCPMCFLHYKEHKRMLRCSQCCSHTICVSCAGDYLQTKGLPAAKVTTASQITSISHQVLTSIACPNCASAGFFPECIADSESVYSYFASPAKRSSIGPASPCPAALTYNSPLRAGDDYESLKRKMIKFPVRSPEESNLDREMNGEKVGEEPDLEWEEGGESTAKTLSFALSNSDQGQGTPVPVPVAGTMFPLAAAFVAEVLLKGLGSALGGPGPGRELELGLHEWRDAGLGQMQVGA